MSEAYRSAVTRIAAHLGAGLRPDFPHDRIICIANAAAGTRHRHQHVVRSATRLAATGEKSHPPVVWSTSPEDGRSAIRAALDAEVDGRLIVMSLGGDGTHNQVLRAGLENPERLRFLRVPLGSGNDSAELSSLDELLDEPAPVWEEAWIPCVQVRGAGLHERAFNIASIGLDAYVTLLHDTWRGVLPGNTYRLLVDLAVLRYDRRVRLGPMQLQGVSVDGGIVALPERARSIVAMGVSGQRTYGDHMRVLPGEENVCLIDQIGVIRKLQLKRQFFAGEHVREPVVSMQRLSRLTIRYAGRLPLQCDGEARWLEPAHFPLQMELLERAVQVLRPARLTATQGRGSNS